MSRKIIETCDRCKKTSEEVKNLNLKTVGVGIKDVTTYSYETRVTFRDNAKREMDLCEACREELGIDTVPRGVPAPENVPTLEDMIRMIVREETGQ